MSIATFLKLSDADAMWPQQLAPINNYSRKCAKRSDYITSTSDDQPKAAFFITGCCDIKGKR